MNVILSIKPKYVEEILKGNKRYEFRKNRFKKDVKEAIVYATNPVGKVVCKFLIGKIIVDTPKNLWNDLRDFSGLTEEAFFAYFENRDKGVAIEIKEIQEFTEPMDLEKITSRPVAPRSWAYLPNI